MIELFEVTKPAEGDPMKILATKILSEANIASHDQFVFAT